MGRHVEEGKADEIKRYAELKESVERAKAARALREAPAMPVTVSPEKEGHRQRMRSLLDDKKCDLVEEVFALVARLVPAYEVASTPEAKAALDKEWEKLMKKVCWVEDKAREFDEVASEAKRTGEAAHFGRIFEICSLKGSELKPGNPNRKYKGRTVFQGNNVVDENADHALFAELGSAPASMEAGKLLDAFGSQPGYSKEQADARQAYTQALFKGIATWIRLPRNRWPKGWAGKFRDPVVPLRLALYGHPDSGGLWEAHCEEKLSKVGFEPVLRDIWKSVFYHPSLKLLLVVYVDDFKMAGPTKNMSEGWKRIGEAIEMDPAEPLGRYFGCEHHEENNVTLTKEHHPFAHVFDPQASKPAAAAHAKEDFWDLDPENGLALRQHLYPRKRLYVPNEDDYRMFPKLGSVRVSAVSCGNKEEEVHDDVCEGSNKNLGRWWTGTTYFDLLGRDSDSFNLAVAASRKGKPHRSKNEAKKVVKNSKFITIDQDVAHKPGCMTKPVNRVVYDMKDFLESCVEMP